MKMLATSVTQPRQRFYPAIFGFVFYSFLSAKLNTSSCRLKPHQNLVQCPFKKEHMVVEDRLQRHVLKCMKNYPNHVKCPYNAIHCFLDKNALEEHYLQCPNKPTNWKNWENKKLYTNDAPIHIDITKNGQEEDWEAEYR